MAATFMKFNVWAEIIQKTVNLTSDQLNIMLTNTLPTTGQSQYTNITEISAVNGYVASGASASIYTNSQTNGLYTLACSSVGFTATGNSIGPFRYVVLFDATVTCGPLIAWWDYGSSISLNTGETFTVSFNSTNPGTVYTLS